MWNSVKGLLRNRCWWSTQEPTHVIYCQSVSCLWIVRNENGVALEPTTLQNVCIYVSFMLSDLLLKFFTTTREASFCFYSQMIAFLPHPLPFFPHSLKGRHSCTSQRHLLQANPRSNSDRRKKELLDLLEWAKPTARVLLQDLRSHFETSAKRAQLPDVPGIWEFALYQVGVY